MKGEMAEPTRWRTVRRIAVALRRYMSVVWLLAVVGLVLAFLYRQHGEVARIGETLGRTSPGWLALAGLLELVVLGLMARTYQLLLARLGYRLPWRALLSAYLQGFAVGAVVPLGGPTSVYVFVRRVERHGVAAGDALLASALSSVVGFTSFLLVMVPALAVLAIEGRLSTLLAAAAGAAALVFALVVAGLLLVLRGPPPPGWLLVRVPARVRESVEHAREHRLQARDLLGPLAISIGIDLAGMTMLYAALRAVGEHPALLLPLAGYQVEMLFNLIAPLFQGIGLVEVSMTVVLEGLGVPAATALAATLVYRVWDLWLPLLLGLVVQVWHSWMLEARQGHPDVPSSGAPGEIDPDRSEAGAHDPDMTSSGATEALRR